MPGGYQRGTMVTTKNTVIFLKTVALDGTTIVRYDSADSTMYGTLGNDVMPYIAVQLGDGDFGFDVNDALEFKLDRGKINDVRDGDEAPCGFSLGSAWTFLKSAANGSHSTAYQTALEVITGKNWGIAPGAAGEQLFSGARESWLSDYGCPPYAFELEVHNNPALSCPGTTAYGEALLFRYCRTETKNFRLQAGSLELSGRANILRPIIIKVACSDTTPAGDYSAVFGYSDIQNAVPLTIWSQVPDNREL